jgi:hypothetical protein
VSGIRVWLRVQLVHTQVACLSAALLAVLTSSCRCYYASLPPPCRYASGARYEGEWRDNLKAGRGVYYFPKVGVVC